MDVCDNFVIGNFCECNDAGEDCAAPNLRAPHASVIGGIENVVEELEREYAPVRDKVRDLQEYL